MLSAALLLFANTLLFSLRLSGGGSFPKPLSAADQRLVNAKAAVDGAAEEVRKLFEKRMVSRLEALIRQAMKDGRTETADSYLKAIESLVPGYEWKDR